ncbi:MAG TPA: hypothetical protein VGD52_05695 [Pseudoduganella sp.]
MDIEVRVSKLEAEVESIKELTRQNTLAIARVEVRMDQGFAELRKEMATNFRWLLGIMLGGFATILGLMGRIAGLY